VRLCLSLDYSRSHRHGWRITNSRRLLRRFTKSSQTH